MIISKSKVNLLGTCPRLFKFQVIEHRKPEVPKADVTQIGIDMHKIFEDFFKAIKFNEIPAKPYEYFCNSMVVKKQYEPMFRHFCKVETEIWNSLENKNYFMPIFTEKKILAGDMNGIIDRVDYDGEDYSIIDYKSTAPMWNPDLKVWEPSPSKVRFELCFYANLINQSNILDKPVKFVGSYGYKNGNLFFEPVKDISFKSMLKKVEAFRKTDFDKIEYPAKPGNACRWCEFTVSCAEENKQEKF